MCAPASCSPPDARGPGSSADDAPGERKQAATALGIERVIPIRVIELLTTSGEAAASTTATIQDFITRANESFRVAGVQFVLRSHDMRVVPSLSNWNAGALEWGTVRVDTQALFPQVPAAWFPDDSSRTPSQWITLAATLYGPLDEIPLVLHKTPGHALFGISPTRVASSAAPASGRSSRTSSATTWACPIRSS